MINDTYESTISLFAPSGPSFLSKQNGQQTQAWREDRVKMK